MDHVVGGKYRVELGEHRGDYYTDSKGGYGFLPDGMLEDGTIVTVTDIFEWCSVDICPKGCAYPRDLLKPLQTKTQRMLSMIKDLQ